MQSVEHKVFEGIWQREKDVKSKEGQERLMLAAHGHRSPKVTCIFFVRREKEFC